jgi:hypothetical protein
METFSTNVLNRYLHNVCSSSALFVRVCRLLVAFESVPDATAFMLVYVKKEFIFFVQCQDIGLFWCTIVLFSLVQGRDESLTLGLRGCA